MNEAPPDDRLLRAWLAGGLPEEERAALEALLEQSPALAERLEALADVEGFRDTFAACPAPPPSVPIPPELMARLKAADFSLTDDETAVMALLDAPPRDGEPGRLGDFAIHGLLAAGGMGFVFDGFDPALRRRVAIKVPAPHLSADPAARARFMAEAQAVAALDHPHIVPIHSVHAHGDRPFFVMPMAEGLTLAQHVAQHGPLTAADAQRVALHAARALAAAHAKGIVHRDVKPANLLLEPDRVRLTDFGIALPEGMAGAFSGTPEFMSPEQRAGEPATTASDVWSLGATLRFAAGHALPAGLTDRLLAPDPSQRPSAAELVRALEPAKAARRPIRLLGRTTAAAAAVIVAGLAASRVPSIADLLNRAIASPQRAFVIEGRFGAHATLADAVAGARSGDVITVHADGPWHLGGIAVTGRLTIRAAPAASPRFLIEDSAAAGMTIRGDLTLERLTIVRGAASGDRHGMLDLRQGSLTMRRCDLRAMASPRRDNAFPCAVLVHERTALHVERSAVIGTWTAPVAIRSAAAGSVRIRLEDAALIGYPVFWMECVPGSEVDLAASRSSLPSPILFADSPATPMPLVRAEVSQCLLLADAALWWTPGETVEELGRRLRWRGTGNLYSQDALFLGNGPRRIRQGPAADLKAWLALPGVSEVSPVTAPPLPPVSGEPSGRHRPVAGLGRPDLEAIAAPWRSKHPDIGADFARLWP